MPDLPPYLRTPLQKEYTAYLQHWHTLVEQQKKRMNAGFLRESPLISIITPVYHPDPKLFHETFQSVIAQSHTHWECILVLDGPQPEAIEQIIEESLKNVCKRHPELVEGRTGDVASRLEWPRIKIIRLHERSGVSEATNTGVRASSGQYVTLLDHDDLLEPHALDLIASTITHTRYSPEFIYCDHDKIDTLGHRYEPEFKPDWSPETLLASCYVGHMKVIRRDTFLALGGFRKEYDGAQDYDFLLRLAECTENILHIPHILYHWRSSPGSTATCASAKSDSIEWGRHAVQDALTRRKKRGEVILPPFSRQFNIGVYALQFDPKKFTERVTIVIPTKDRSDLLEPCIRSIREKTAYPHYEILVINNGKPDKRLLKFLEQEGVRHLDIETDEFNFSSLHNQAMQKIETPFVLFLNNDTEVLKNDWLLQMLGTLLLDERIGAVGAKLLFPDGRTQHSGVILGLNDFTAGHANLSLPGDDSGYRNSNRALRNCAAVTAACLLTRTALFREVGGFDEKHFPIAYNDVDYCLKILAKGYRIAQAPDAVLLHYQGASRGHIFHSNAEYASRAHLRRMWSPILCRDPYSNPNLSLRGGNSHIRSHPHGKRILFVSHNLEYEGASLSLLELAIKLKERNCHVEVACSRSGPLAEMYKTHDIPLHIGAGSGQHPVLDLARDDFDILFLNTITLAALLHSEDIAAHPIVWCIRESEYDYYAQTLPQFSPQLFSKASRVLFVSNATREIYSDLDRGHFATIYNGIDIAKIDEYAARSDREALRKELHIDSLDTVITIIGTICPRKGQREFVLTAIDLLKYTPHRLQFLLIGGRTQSPYEEEVQDTIARSGFADRIRIIPKTHDIHRYYASTDIFVCNSSIESFPRVILEAMAWRLPIVSTDVFGISEQLQHKGEALLIPPQNPSALRAALRRLIEDPKLRTTLGKGARKQVEHSFGIERMIDQYEELFGALSSS